MVHEIADVAPGTAALRVQAQLHAARIGSFVEPRVGIDTDPLAGVLLDVHGLDEWLHEAEKIRDSHQCDKIIISRLVLDLFRPFGGKDLAGEKQREIGRAHV